MKHEASRKPNFSFGYWMQTIAADFLSEGDILWKLVFVKTNEGLLSKDHNNVSESPMNKFRLP